MSRRVKNNTDVARSWVRPLSALLAFAGLAATLSPQRAHADTIVDQGNSIILVNTTWDLAGSPYLLQRDVEVRPSATLTIMPGVEVRFANSDATQSNEDPLGVEFIIKGALVANGTEAEPISFNGQNLAGPLAHATGLRFEAGASSSSLAHVRMEGLAYGVDVRAGNTFNLSADNLYIDAGKTAFRRSAAMGDQLFSHSTLIAPEGAIDVVSSVEDGIFTLDHSEVQGDVTFRGDLTISSELNVLDSLISGDVSLMGGLQAASQLVFERSEVSLGRVYVQGGVNTNATLRVIDSTLRAAANRAALSVDGAVLADASVEISGSSIIGDLKVGPQVQLAGVSEGQYVFVETPSTWAEAQASCASMGGRLADASTARESELLYELAKRSGASGLAWTAGTLTAPPCGPGSTYIDVGSQGQCQAWSADQFPIRTVTTGKDCACGTQCPSRDEIRDNQCFPYNFTCTLGTSYQARLPDCDTGDVSGEYCYGDSVSWLWDNGAAFDQSAALWAQGEADRLACFSGEHNLMSELHIAIDVQDATGSPNGRLGMWRARDAAERYGYVCEGRLALVSSQDSSRGSLTLTNNTLTGRFESHLGALTLTNNTFEGVQNHTLFRAASVVENSFVGAFNLTSRSIVTISRNSFRSSELSSGGVIVEGDFTSAYGNTVDGGEQGMVFRGPARVENNIITRSLDTAIALYPEQGPSPTDETVVISNTLVQNNNGVSVQGTVNAPRVTLANNLIHQGAGVGVSNLGTSAVSASYNNVSAYGTMYQNVSAGTGAMSVNPVLVEDFSQSETPILRLDSGSPLIDVGHCPLATALDFDGAPRPFDGDFDQTPGCDIGAYEFGPSEVFIYADGVPATPTTFSTGREVTLSLWGVRDGFYFEVNPVDWSLSEAVGVFDEASGRFRPSPTPGVYAGAINAGFGALTASLDVDLDCGCVAPDLADGSSGGCNDVPECYYTDWSSSCNVRENYCRVEQIVDVGSFDNPLVIAADETVKLRAGGRDLFGTVFRITGPFTYDVVAGGGTVDSLGRFTASQVSGDYPQTLRISKGAISGLSNVIVTPAEPHSIVINKPAQSVGTTRTLQYSATVLDRFGNVIPDAPITWSINNAADAQINATGRVTAGCVPGTFAEAVTATSGLIEQRSDLIVTVGGANVVDLAIAPASVELAATLGVNFEAFVTDSCGYTRPAQTPVFTSRVTAGTITPTTGAFSASCNLGAHPTAVTVAAEGFESTAAVTISDAPLAAVRLQPENARIEVNTSAVFQAIGEDACGRAKDVSPLWSTNIVNATMSVAGDVDFQRLNVSCANLNTYASGVRATVSANGAVYQAVASVDVVAGVPDSLTVNQVSLSLPAGNEVQLVASAEDVCGNPRDDALRYQASNGSVDASGLYTAGCTRGEYPSAIFVRAGSLSSSVNVTVTDGVLNSIEIEPSAVTLQAGESRQMRANLYDGCRNIIAGTPTWSVAQGGAISPSGVLTAGTSAGVYNTAVIAELGSFQDKADLTITPAAADQLVVSPNPMTIAAGTSVALETTAFDRFGNAFTADPTWSVNPEVGVVTADDVFIASSRVGTYNDAIIARVGAASTPIDVEIVPAAISSILIEALEPPTGEPVDLINLVAGQAQTVTFEATALDAFGNEVSINPALFQWSVTQGGGSAAPLSGLPRALYTVGTKAQAHTVTATIGDVTGSIPVTIRPASPAHLFVFDVVPPNNTIAQVTLEPNQSYQLGVRVEDAFQNTVSMPVTYSIVRAQEDLLADPPVIPVNATISPSGLIRAGTIAGEAMIVVTATQSLVVGIDLTVVPGEPASIAISPEQVVLAPQESVALTATIKDAFDNVIVKGSPTQPSASISWADLDVTGSVTPTGLFTAGNVAGTFARALVVRGRGLERFVDVTVLPGAPISAQISPNPIITTTGSELQLSLIFRDAQGNVTTAPNATITWGLTAGSTLEIGADGLLRSGCINSPNLYENAVQVTVNLPGVQAPLNVIEDVEVRPGLTQSIIADPVSQRVPVNGVFSFTATAKDACGYTTTAIPQWSIRRGEGTITAQGLFVASSDSTFPTPEETGAGEPVLLVASVGEIESDLVRVTISPDSIVSLELDPPEVTDAMVTDRVPFRAIAEDAHGNRWVPSVVEWSVQPTATGLLVGQISEQGILEASTVSGVYPRSVQATVDGRSAKANVTLRPDVPNHISIDPNPANLIPNQVINFEATVFDQYDNVITDVEPEFTCMAAVGLCQASGVLTATDRVGDYLDHVEARVGNVVARADVYVRNSDPASIEISPESVTAAMGSVVVFSATVYDEQGVEIEGATVEWSQSDLIGTLNRLPNNDLRFTIKDQPPEGIQPNERGFNGYVDATLTFGDTTLSSSVNVYVPYDFDADGILDNIELENGLDPEDAADADLDFDNDGLTNSQELNNDLDIRDADTDNDGVIDGDEPSWDIDTDRDGLINALDDDSDDDGLLDGTELGVTQPTADTEASDSFIPDEDPDTTTDPLRVDSDGDGLNDGVEDANRNGRLDPGETPSTRDFNYIYCNPTAEETGCPAGLICLETICTEPEQEDNQAPDEGCDAQQSAAHHLLWLLAVVALVVSRRRRLV